MQEGGLRLDSYEALLGEGDSGAKAVVPGKLPESEALRRIATDDEFERMPLEADPLPQEQIALVRRWIDQGAKFDGPDAKAPLASILPAAEYPNPPEAYPSPLPITALAFNSDGTRLLVGGYHELTVWKPETGELVERIKNFPERIYAVRYSPDGKRVAVAGGASARRGEVRLLNVADDGTLQSDEPLLSTSGVVFDAVFSPTGDRLACAGEDNIVRVYDVATGEEPRLIESHSDWVMAVAFSPDGAKLATASRDKTAKVFDTASGELLMTYSGHGETVSGVAVHPDGDHVFSAGGDGQIHLWKIEDGKKTADIGGLGGEVFKLATSEEFLFAPSAGKQVRQYKLEGREEVRAYPSSQDWALTCDYHGGTNRLATGSFDGRVRTYDAENGEPLAEWIAAPGYKPPDAP